MTGQPSFARARPLLFGHRGAPAAAGLRENTIESFARAVDDGATALETDVHRTADGHIVLCHDPIVGGVEIKSATLADVRAACAALGFALPLLGDMLARFPSVPVNVDLKQREPSMERAVVDVVGKDAERVLLASFHKDVLDRVRALDYRGPTGLARDEVARLLYLPAVALRVWRLRGARAQVPRKSERHRFDTRAFVDKCHRLGIAVDFWTINDVDEARELLALGADGIMSDDPGRVRAAFA